MCVGLSVVGVFMYVSFFTSSTHIIHRLNAFYDETFRPVERPSADLGLPRLPTGLGQELVVPAPRGGPDIKMACVAPTGNTTLPLLGENLTLPSLGANLILPSLGDHLKPDPLFQDLVNNHSHSPAYQALLTFLSPIVLFAFADRLKKSTLAAHTSRKGLSCLMAALRKVCGGRGLSQVNYQTKFAARETIGCLQDLITSLNRAASRAINATEGRKLLSMSTRPRAEAFLHALYLCMEIHKYWFFAKLSGDISDLTPFEQQLLCGYAIARVLLARPVTRCEALHSVQLSQVSKQLCGGSEPAVTLVLASHKTLASYGALFVLWDAAYISNELALYVGRLRPLLLASPSDWGRTPKTSLFPKRAALFATSFLSHMGKLNNLTLAQIRKFFVEHLAQLPTSHEVRELQATAAHESSMKMKHYSFATKRQRDENLSALVKNEFVTPASARTQEIARPHVLPECKYSLAPDYGQPATPLALSPPSNPMRTEAARDSGANTARKGKRKATLISRLCGNKASKKRSRVCVSCVLCMCV